MRKTVYEFKHGEADTARLAAVLERHPHGTVKVRVYMNGDVKSLTIEEDE